MQRRQSARARAGQHPEYLLGNHVVAERLFRHDPATATYVPLRVVVRSDADDQAVFTIDRPSSVFDSWGNTEITGIGVELDQKVVRLLQVITGRMPDALLTDAGPPRDQ